MATRRAVRRALDVVVGKRNAASVSSTLNQQHHHRHQRALSASSASTSSEKTPADALAKRIEDAVREGRRPAFTDVAEHVFTERRRGGGGAGGGRGWDWHAWHFFVALLPSAAAYACVRYINEHYEPELVALMEQQRAIEAERLFGALERSKAERADASGEEEEEKSKALELRIADLEAKLAALTAAATSANAAAEKKPTSDASPVDSTKKPAPSDAKS
jgi:hypothetical protein